MPNLWIPGADTKSYWFGDDFAGISQGDLDKLVLHSTETPRNWKPWYGGGGSAPTVTINPWKGYRKRWQHFTANRSARALLNPSSTPVSENKDHVAQIEIIGYSDPTLGKRYGCYIPDLDDDGLAYIAETVAWFNSEWDIKLVRPSGTWPMYRIHNDATFRAARMTSSQYDRYAGVLAHLHVSGNDHRDVAIKIDRLLELARSKSGSGSYGSGGSTPTGPSASGGGTAVPVPAKDGFDMADIADLEKVVAKYTPKPEDQGTAISQQEALERLLILARRSEVREAALSAAVKAMAGAQGIDPKAVESAIDKAVKEALSDLRITSA